MRDTWAALDALERPQHLWQLTPSMRKRFERDSMDIEPITTKAHYRAALKAVESLMTANADTPEGDRLDVLTMLV